MDSNELRDKLNRILQAIAAGHSCEQILASDRSLSYHDIFHAVAEAPTTYWSRISARHTPKGSPKPPNPPRSPVRQRTD